MAVRDRSIRGTTTYLFIYLYIYIHKYTVFIFIYIYCLIKGSLEVKLPTSWTDEKAEVGRAREEKRRKKIRESEKEKEPSHSKVAKHCVFPMIVAPEGRKIGSLKRRVRSRLGR